MRSPKTKTYIIRHKLIEYTVFSENHPDCNINKSMKRTIFRHKCDLMKFRKIRKHCLVGVYAKSTKCRGLTFML